MENFNKNPGKHTSFSCAKRRRAGKGAFGKRVEKKTCFFYPGVLLYLGIKNALLAQLDRASGYGPEGQGFESLTACQKRAIPFGMALFWHAVRDSNHNRTPRWGVRRPVRTSGRHLNFFSRPPRAKRNASESLTACVPPEAGQEAGSLSFERCCGEFRFAGTSSGASRHLPRARGRLWRIPYSVRSGAGGTGGRVTELRKVLRRIPLRGDLIRRFAPPSPCAGKALANPNQRASRRRRDKGLDPSSPELLRMTDPPVAGGDSSL